MHVAAHDICASRSRPRPGCALYPKRKANLQLLAKGRGIGLTEAITVKFRLTSQLSVRAGRNNQWLPSIAAA
jgi:hypothetical protein